jgi:cyclophilin family peptidyl-prolyl cis-trans isomerase
MRTHRLVVAFSALVAVVSLIAFGCASKAPVTPTESEPETMAKSEMTGAPKTEAPAETANAKPEEPSAPESVKTETPTETPQTETPKPEAVKPVPQKPVAPAEPSLIVAPSKPKLPTGVPDEEVVVIETNRGRIVLELYPGDAPQHVENFKKLVKDRFYEGRANTFHRYVPDFVIQGGDPLGRDRQKAGTGGPGYTLPAEIKRKHVKGAVAAARLPDNANPNKESSGSQFYICLQDLAQLDGEYTVFGQVIEGMDVVARLRQGDEMRKLTLEPRASHAK